MFSKLTFRNDLASILVLNYERSFSERLQEYELRQRDIDLPYLRYIFTASVSINIATAYAFNVI